MLNSYEPCLPTKAAKPPSGDIWVHEIKLDGYRLVARRAGDRVTLRTRGGFDWSGRYPRIVTSILHLDVRSIVLDGEVAWINEDGVSDFNALHSRANDEWAPLLAFDILELNGDDLRGLPLLERKRRLKKLLGRKGRNGLQYVDHLEGDGGEIFEHACRLGLEGIVSKRADSVYRPGRCKIWLKTKNRSHPAYLRVAESFER
jgi:ATP-dependent DNA ligase